MNSVRCPLRSHPNSIEIACEDMKLWIGRISRRSKTYILATDIFCAGGSPIRTGSRTYIQACSLCTPRQAKPSTRSFIPRHQCRITILPSNHQDRTPSLFPSTSTLATTAILTTTYTLNSSIHISPLNDPPTLGPHIPVFAFNSSIFLLASVFPISPGTLSPAFFAITAT